MDDEDEIEDILGLDEVLDSEDGLRNLSSLSGNLSVEESRFKSLGEDALYPFQHLVTVVVVVC